MQDKDNLRYYTFIRMRFWSFYGTEELNHYPTRKSSTEGVQVCLVAAFFSSTVGQHNYIDIPVHFPSFDQTKWSFV